MNKDTYLDRLATHIDNVTSHSEGVEAVEAEMIKQGATPEEMEEIQKHRDAITFIEERNNRLLIEMQEFLNANKPKD